MTDYLVRPLGPDTWDAFAGLAERHNGLWCAIHGSCWAQGGGCWCMRFQRTYAGRLAGACAAAPAAAQHDITALSRCTLDAADPKAARPSLLDTTARTLRFAIGAHRPSAPARMLRLQLAGRSSLSQAGPRNPGRRRCRWTSRSTRAYKAIRVAAQMATKPRDRD